MICLTIPWIYLNISKRFWYMYAIEQTLLSEKNHIELVFLSKNVVHKKTTWKVKGCLYTYAFNNFFNRNKS